MSGETQEFGPGFIRRYSELMTAVWASDQELTKLLNNPTQYAIEKGLPVAPGATVKVDRTQPQGLFQKSTIIEDWSSTPGSHVLHVPATPLIELSELTDAELDTVSAGTDNNNYIVIVV